jgi:hypothetical protein
MQTFSIRNEKKAHIFDPSISGSANERDGRAHKPSKLPLSTVYIYNHHKGPHASHHGKHKVSGLPS